MEKKTPSRSPVTLTFLPPNYLPHDHLLPDNSLPDNPLPDNSRPNPLPSERVVLARSGDTILDAALDNAIALPHECGGNCACTTCHVIVVAGGENLSPQEEVEADRLCSAAGCTVSSRLGCQAILQGGDVIVSLAEAEN